jgi:RNA polymerase sigma-54 factor
MAAGMTTMQPRAAVGVKTRVRLAPNLVQGMKVLAMPLGDLAAFASRAAEENPLLEVDFESDPFRVDHLPDAAERARAQRRRQTEGSAQAAPFEWDFSRMADAYSETESLAAYLRLQEAGLDLTEDELAVFDEIVDGLSDEGYFCGSVPEMAFELGMSEDAVAGVLAKVRTLDPAGVGASSLGECLALQVDASFAYADQMRQILRRDLQRFAANKAAELARDYRVPQRAVAKMRAMVRTMDPRPGLAFSQRSAAQYVVPDIVVRMEDGRIDAQVAGAAQPCLRLNAEYLDMLEEQDLQQEALAYLAARYREARVVLNNLDQRRRMLQLFAAYLVKKQYRFFATEGQQLEPMTMRMVAEDLDVSVSTVSRTVQGKYLQAPWGTVSLKSLFTRAVECEAPGAAPGEISSFEVKNTIRALIEHEAAEAPLSDAKITQVLNGRGIDIKRRTVAKYRNELGIGTQSARKLMAVS